MKVHIRSWRAVATWHWSLPHTTDEDVCGICRVQFDGTCPTCKFPGDSCQIVQGKCRHAFHAHCLYTWIEQDSSKNQCPMCRRVFELVEEGGEEKEGEGAAA